VSDGDGQIVTFYSYKGGTGRTMALANLAVLFARERAGDVLMIDWDLEAPGLDRFFTGHLELANGSLDEHLGLLDLFEAVRDHAADLATAGDGVASAVWADVDFAPYLVPTDIPSLFLMKAGRLDAEYPRRVNTFDWESLYTQAPGIFGRFVDVLRSRFRFVLVDARTGVTDSSGICTMLLPDRLVVVFTPNRQSLTGVVELVERATEYRQASSDLRPLLVFPLASRIELSEDDLRRRWRFGDGQLGIEGYEPTFEELFRRVYDLPACELEPYFDEVQIQHSTRFSYGEELAVLVESGTDRLSLSRSFESLSRALESSTGAWTFGREAMHPGEVDERRAADVGARLGGTVASYKAQARGARRWRLALRIVEGALALVLAFGFLGALLTPDYVGAIIVGVLALVVPLPFELFIRRRRWSARAAILDRAADTLTREQLVFESGAGPYAGSATRVAVLAEHVEEVIAETEAQLDRRRSKRGGSLAPEARSAADQATKSTRTGAS
jgi:cellulose biosynthesis protein BcsQ